MPLCLVTFLVSLLSVSVLCGTIRERGQLSLNSNEYTFQSSVTDGTYLYFIANTASGYGKMVRVNPTTFTRSASVTGSTTGTNYWRCVAQSGGYAYVGTYEAVANLHQITLSTMTVVSSINLHWLVTSTGSGFNYAVTVQIVGSYAYFGTFEYSPSIVRIAIPGFTYSTSTTISSSYCQHITSSGQYGGYLFFTCSMTPSRLMRFDYTNMAYSTYVSGNPGDNYFNAMAISGSVAYVACNTAPGRLVQFNLATMTYVLVVSGAPTGENYFISVYVSGAFVYVTTATSPSRIVRFYTTTMVRLFAIFGNPLNDWSLTAPVAFGAYVYYATSSSSINPGVISRFNFGVTNSPSASPSLSSDDTLTLSRGTSSGSGSLDATHSFSPSLSLSRSRSLGWTSSNAVVPFPNPGTTMRRSSQLLLRLNDVSFQSGFTDGTYLYYVSNSAYGQMVRIDPVTFTRVDAVNGSSTGTNNWYCVASSGGYAYVGTTESTNARILRIALSSMTVTGTLTLTGHGLIITAELVGDFVVFATDETIPFIATVNINNANFFVSRTTTVSSVFCQLIRASGQYGGYIFFACQMFPGRLMRFDYTNMAYSGYVAGNAGDNTFYAMAIVGSLAYVACGVNPGRLVKFNLATMAYIAGVSGVTGENYFLSVFVQGAYVYTTTNTSPSRIVRFDPKTMTRLFAVSGNPLTDSALLAPVQFGAYVYYATSSTSINPGVVSRFRLDVTLTATPSRSLGWTSSNAIVPFPNPGTTVRRSSQLLLNSNEIGFQSGFTDGTYLYYVANAAYGQMVRIDPVTFTRVDAVSGSSTGTNNWYCVASSGGYAYVGTTESTNARILRIKLSSMTVTGTLTLTGHSLIITAELVGNFVYFATHEATPFIAAVNITNSSFSVSQTMTVSTAYCQLIRSSGQYGGYIFFVCQMSPGRLMRFDYNTMKYSGYVAAKSGDNTFYAMAIVGSLAYVACGVNPGRLVKFNLATMAYIAGVSGVTGENYFLSVFVQGAYVYTTTNTSPSKIVRFDPKLMTRLFAVSGNPLTDSALLAPVQFGAYVYYASASSNPGVVSRFRLDVTLTGTHSFSEKSSKSRSSSAHSFSLANSQTYTTTLSHFPGSTSITCSFSESAISLSISMSPSLSPTQSTDSKSKTLSRSRGSQSGSASVTSTSSSPSVAARRATGTRTASSATASPSTSLSPTQSQSTDSRSNTLSRSRGSRSGSATLTSTSSSPTVAARRATGTRTASSATTSTSLSPTQSTASKSKTLSRSRVSQSRSAVTTISSSPSVAARRATATCTASSATVSSSTSLLELSPTMVPTMMYMTFTGIAADKTVTFSRTLTAAASDSTSDSTNSITRLVSISAIVPVYINVTGDIFDSIVGEFISPGGKNETTLTVVAALDRNVVATRRAYFSTPKVTALKANGGVVSVRLRLLPQVTIRFSLTGQRVALGTEGLTATVVNQTDLLFSMRATGSQYLATVANVNIPLANLLAGNVRVTGSTELPIQFVLTATTVTALTVSTSLASVTGPISAIAGTTPASAMAVLRLSILIDILQCGFGGDDGGANLFSLTIGPSPGASLRGAVVGNLVFIAAFVALLGILILAFLAYGWVTFNTPPGAMLPDLLNIFHFPGIVLIPVSAACQPTLTAAVQLIALEPLNGDVTFGVLGAVALLLVLMVPYTVVIATQFCLRLVEKSDNSGAHKQHGAQPPSLPRRIVSTLFSERATWQPIDPTRPDQVAWKKRFAPVFLDCSVWWYPLVDLWSGAAVGVVGGLTLGNKSVCLFQLAVVAFSYAFIALLQLAVAPPLVFASRCYVVMLQVLGLISCGAVLAAAVTNDNEEDSTSVAVASISMLLIAVLSTVKSALDVLFLLIAIPGRVRRAAGVGALHCLPSPMSSPGDSVHRRGSAVELMLYDAVEEDELGPMMFEGDVVGRREEDEEEVHHNPITEYVNPTTVEEPQQCSRKEKSSFRRSNNVKGMKQQQHHHVDESTGSLAGGTHHDDNLVMSQTTSTLQRMTSNDHIVVNITDATTSEGVSDVSHGGGVTRRGSTLDHLRPKKPTARPLSAAQQHAPTRFDDPFGDNPTLSEVRDTNSSFSHRPRRRDPNENAQIRNAASIFDGAVSPGILPIKSIEIPAPVLDDGDDSFGGNVTATKPMQVDNVVLDDKDRSHITKRAAMMLKVASMRAPRRDGFTDHASTVEELQLLYRTEGDAM